MSVRTQLYSLIKKTADADVIKKIVFSKPEGNSPSKQVARLCAHKGGKYLALEATLEGGKVSHTAILISELEKKLPSYIEGYMQINLVTSVGQAEYKRNKKGNEALTGASSIEKQLSLPVCEENRIINEGFDRKKSYILRGDEDFLKHLEISDKNGRVHDKKQGKFRQINRFLLHIEDIYPRLSEKGTLTVYDLCCGKSYLSFAVYYYFKYIKKRDIFMLCIDLKRDVIEYCAGVADAVGFSGMKFVCDDVKNTPKNVRPDLVISLHACDVATDIVINHGASLRARVILSTPCCHHYLNDKIDCAPLKFVSGYGHLRNKLCESLTDALRLLRLRSHGYDVTALELTDPDDTPKNTLLRAIYEEGFDETSSEAKKRQTEYENALTFILGGDISHYLEEIK